MHTVNVLIIRIITVIFIACAIMGMAVSLKRVCEDEHTAMCFDVTQI